jgi:plastocyanin
MNDNGDSYKPGTSSPGNAPSSSTPAASPSSSANTGVTIHIQDNVFVDGNMTVAPGTRVTYVNDGMHNHTVTIHQAGTPTDVILHDQKVTSGQSDSFTFAVPGTYHVWCKYHGTMLTGMATTVVVQ